MIPQKSDTEPEVQRVRFELIRKIPVWKRLALMGELTHTTRLMMRADLCRRFPRAGEEELQRRFIASLLTRDEVIAAYHFDPENESDLTGPSTK